MGLLGKACRCQGGGETAGMRRRLVLKAICRLLSRMLLQMLMQQVGDSAAKLNEQMVQAALDMQMVRGARKGGRQRHGKGIAV